MQGWAAIRAGKWDRIPVTLWETKAERGGVFLILYGAEAGRKPTICTVPYYHKLGCIGGYRDLYGTWRVLQLGGNSG